MVQKIVPLSLSIYICNWVGFRPPFIAKNQGQLVTAHLVSDHIHLELKLNLELVVYNPHITG